MIFKVGKNLEQDAERNKLIFHWKQQLAISIEAKMKYRVGYPGASIINCGKHLFLFDLFIPVMQYQIHGSDDNITLIGIAGILVT